MIRPVAAALIALSVLLVSGLRELTRADDGIRLTYMVGDRQFTAPVPAGFCAAADHDRTAPSIRRLLDRTATGGLIVDLLALPCDRLDDADRTAPNGTPLHVIVVGRLARDGRAVTTDKTGRAVFDALVGGLRYTQLVLGPETAARELARLIQQGGDGYRIDTARPLFDGNGLAATIAGQVVNWPARPVFRAGTFAAPIDGYFRTVGIVDIGAEDDTGAGTAPEGAAAIRLFNSILESR